MQFSTTIIFAAALGMGVQGKHHNNDESEIRPRQGVFLLSNQPTNQVGVWESLEDDGALVWKGRYDTGGVGYPDPTDDRHLDDLGSSNAVHYHTWNNKQWLLAANAGGPENTPSMTLFEVQRDLELVIADVIPLEGVFPCSVAGYGDRACAVTCAGNATMECFQISPEGKLTSELAITFLTDLPEREGRPNSVDAALGPGNILFSPDGDQVGIVMKGSAVLENPHPHQRAGFYSFPITDRDSDTKNVAGYGPPSFHALANEIIPFAFTWRPGPTKGQAVAVTVNIAGESQNFPACDEDISCRSSIISIAANVAPTGDSVSLSIVDDAPLDVIDGCWIEYRDDRMYTANFFSDSITVSTVLEDGSIEVERTVPIGIDTIPNDLTTAGPKVKDGAVFMYSENQGRGAFFLGDIGVHKLLTDGDDGLVQVLQGAPLPSGSTEDAWAGNNGLTSTTISEQELFDLYEYKLKKKY